MVARSDRAELGDGFPAVFLHAGTPPRIAVVKQFMPDSLFVDASDTERNDLADIGQNRRNAIFDVDKRRIEPDGHIAATNVEANPRDADLLLVGDDAAHRLRITEMAIGADDALHRVADGHAVPHLGNGVFVVVAEDRQWTILEPLLLRAKIDDLGREIGCLAGVPRSAGGVAGGAPRPHSTWASPLFHARIEICPRGEAHIAGRAFQRIGTVRWILCE